MKNISDSTIISKALDEGLDLREFSSELNKNLEEKEKESIETFLSNTEEALDLHMRVEKYDAILEQVENMLTGFQENLGGLSREIRHLQDQSTSMGVKLGNRKSVRHYLSQMVDELVVPEEMISIICSGNLADQSYMEQLHQLQRKIKFAREQSFHDTKACSDVHQVIENLRIKASSRIRSFLLDKVYQFRKPLANYHIPQNAMLRYRFFYEFILANERSTAQEIKDQYLETVSKIYYSYFRSYLQRLMKLKFSETANRTDLIGVVHRPSVSKFSGMSISKAFGSMLQSTTAGLKHKETVFTLGNRKAVIESELEATIIVPHAERIQDQSHSFESLFRSIHFALLDCACREYLFIMDFYLPSAHVREEMFQFIFQTTLQSLITHLEGFLVDCWDSIAVFLCIHIILRYQVTAHEREVPVLDSFYKNILGLLWPRMMEIVNANVASIRSCEVDKLGKIDVRPHIITRRYAEYYTAISGLNESFPDQRVDDMLESLSAEVKLCITRMSSIFQDSKSKLIFLINNYDMLLSILSCNSKADNDSDAVYRFEQALNAVESEYISLSISPMLSLLEDITKDIESNRVPSDERVLNAILKFKGSWKNEIDRINEDNRRSFQNFHCGSRLLQSALTKLVEVYAAFFKAVSGTSLQKARAEMTNVQKFMVEVKEKRPQL